MVLQFGARDGRVWNRRVCVGSLENLDLRKLKVESTPEGRGAGRGVRGKLWADVEKSLWIGIWELQNWVESEAIDW